MSVSKNKPHLKIIKKLEPSATKTVNSLPIDQNVGQQQKRKRNRFKNIDWEQVLDFDTLVLNSQVYEAPWMKTTKKRKKICRSSDKNESTSSLLVSSNDVKDSDNTNDSVSTTSINDSIAQNAFQKITSNQEGNMNGGNRSKGEKQQKKYPQEGNSSNNTNQYMNLESSSNMKGRANDDSFDQDSLQQNKQGSNQKTKKTRLQSQKERELNTLQEESISQQNSQQQNIYTNDKTLTKNANISPVSSRNNTLVQEERANTPSKAVTRQEEKNKANSNTINYSDENLEINKSPDRNQYRKKIVRKVLKSDEEKDSIKNENKESQIEVQNKNNSYSNGKGSYQQPTITRSQSKHSPSSSRLNEDTMVINQSYDDSDASTRDEDHLDNNSLPTQLKSNKTNKNFIKDNRRITRACYVQEKTPKDNTPMKKMGDEKNKVGELEQEEVEKIHDEIVGEDQESEEGNKKQQENEQGSKDQQASVIKIKQLKKKPTSSVEVGNENQINKKKGNNNINQKQSKRVNKNLIKKQIDEIVDSNQTPLLICSEQNTSEKIEMEGNTQSVESLSKFQSLNTLNDESRSVQSSFVQNQEDQYIQHKKSKFSKKKKQTQENSSASLVASEQNLDKMEEEMNVDESGFENSNNNAITTIIHQQNNQQEVDLEQQQVPHLYIRNSDYATKVGRKYQAVIPELGSYQAENNHLNRLISEQKVWGRDWIQEKQQKIIVKCTATLKQWYGSRRNEEQCIQHLMLLDFDQTKYNQFLEENQDLLYNLYDQMDNKFLKKKAKKKSLFSNK